MIVDKISFVLLTGSVIFFARVLDVSLGTLRTISIVHGRKWTAFWLGFFEIIIWLAVVSTVIQMITEIPLLGIFYAFGFATGNMVGIQLENRLAMGFINLRIISGEHYKELSEILRKQGYAVTTFQGEGKYGTVVELYIACRRKNLREILETVHTIEPDVFYTTEHAASVSRVYGPIYQPVTGWSAIFKKK